jgi:hypothetical protein
MPGVSISPILNAQVVKDNGDPASGWKIFTYIANSTTPQPAYTDSSGSVAHSNPIVLDASGFSTQGEIWLVDGVFYKFVLTDENNVLRRTFNDISGVNDPSQVSGEQWLDLGTAATFLTANSFSLVGDQVGEYHVGRRVQLKLGVSFAYGYITASSFAVDDQLTTVTVKLDNAATLNNALTQSNLSLLRADHHALPKIDYELNSLLVDNINATTINMSGAINEAPQVTLASAATVNIGAAASNSILITGTTTINSFGTAAAGILRTLEFQSSLTLTYNATSMQLPGAANIITQPGDVLFAYSKGGGNWKIISYSLASGSSIAPAGFTRVQVYATPGSYNFTVPAGVTRVKVTVTGGGSAGEGGGDNPYPGSGAGTALKWIDGLTPGQVIPVVVGAGGVPFPGNPVGTASSFGAFCTGQGSAQTGPPGTGIGGDINLAGRPPSTLGGTSYWGGDGYGKGGDIYPWIGVVPNPSGRGGIVVVEY